MVSKDRFPSQRLLRLSPFLCKPWLEEVNKWSVAYNTQCGFEEPTPVSAPASSLSLSLQSMVRRSKKSRALRKKHLGFYTSSSRECSRCELQTQEMKFPRVCLRLERSETLAQTGTAITTRMRKS